MRYTGPKARLCRREGVNLFGSPKYQKALDRKPGIPGMHGVKRMGKLTEYAKQLREKQKAKRIFGLSEKQFRRNYDKAARSTGVTGDTLLQLLERRLDNVIYRAGFALTRSQARQVVSHGHVMANGRRVDIPSIDVRPGDVFELRDRSKKSSLFAKVLEENENYKAPSWLKVDPKKMTIEILEYPDADHFEKVIEPRMIVEFYSR